ncbi:hypothetical protein FE257_010912 [Aspergillus nanangensis]|uniref:Rhodopsin domain-containing protein n=1 Tax=Aspergillus nanangensis TaxID=2582783 RepID=A0AAD4CVR0_ASPNN|nr:hypothetical protein FE257_010912 [Aspergillus nanangensis]
MGRPSDITPPPGAVDRDRGAIIVSILWIETAIGAIVICLRFIGRYMIRKIGWDDWLMLLTWGLFMASTVVVQLQASVGGYRHIYFLSQEASTRALELNFILRGVHILSLATGKASIGAQILRLLVNQQMWQRWLVWGVLTLTVLVNVLNCIFKFVQCMPVEANWNPEIEGNCWPKQAQLGFAYFMSSTTTIL